ncbi:MAG TPA: hypothetical protein VFS75_03135, partial [Candidatus Paceibacterota bacterium]|nr:hypothetical protein [Candidatus Paceibacterota bacterium]
GVIGIESAVKKAGGLWGNHEVALFHLTLVAVATVVFLMVRFGHTGLKRPVVHRRLVYAFFTLYTLAFLSGTWLIYAQFPPT